MIQISLLTRKRKKNLHIKALASFVDNLEYPLEGELVSRDCLKVLKQLKNLMKDYGRKSLGQGALLADYDQLDG
jgi:hypothetical protein